MATTLIENIVNELTELVVQKVLEEFNQRADLVPDHEARLNALERANFVRRADLYDNFVTRDDLLVDEALINNRLVAMENALSAQPCADKNFVDEQIKTWAYENFDYEVINIIDRYDMTAKIEDTLRDFDLVEEAVENEIRNRTLVTEDDLIEFINDRVRLTTE